MALAHDLRLALRGLVRSPGFSLIAVLTVALGIGASTAIFSVLEAVLLRPLPFPDAEALVVVGQARQAGVVDSVSWIDAAEWRRDARSLAALAAWHDEQLTLAGEERAERLRAVAASANLFTTLGVTPALGRGFAAGEDERGKNRVVVLSHGAWQRLLGGDRGVIGRGVVLDGVPHTVIGVLGADFRFPMREREIEAFVPVPRPWDEAMMPRRAGSYLMLVGRLAPGATVASAQAELDGIAARQARDFPAESSNRHVTVRSLHQELVAGLRPALLLLFGAVAFVLLIACANVANLLLARATARRREIAVRMALGAGRGRIAAQLLVESVTLGVVGGAFGVLLALWGLDALRAFLPPEALAIRPIAVDTRALLFTFVVAVGTGLIFGVLPALQVSAADPQEALRDGGRAGDGPAGGRARRALVALETGVASLLLVGALLMLTSYSRLSRVDPGFDAADLVTSNVFLPDARYGQGEASASFYHAWLERLRALPGARAAAIAFPLPFSNMNLGISYEIAGEPPAQPGLERSASLHVVSPGYLGTLGIPLRGGRDLRSADDRRDAPAVVIVSEGLARKLFPGGDALGKRLVINWQGPVAHEIVGIAGDIHGAGLGGLDAPPAQELYVPFGRTPFPFVTFAVRGSADAPWAKTLAGALAGLDGTLGVEAVRPMTELIAASLARPRLATVLLTLFGAIAMLLAVIGLYGVMSYLVSLRRREIGIRVALGARTGQVTRLVVGQGLRLAGVGALLGLGGALAMSRLVASQLYGVTATDPLVYVVAASAILATSAVAAWLPGRRAARIDPMAALRDD